MPIANAFTSGWEAGEQQHRTQQQEQQRLTKERDTRRSDVAKMFNDFRAMYPQASYADYRNYIDQVTGGDSYLSGSIPTDSVLRSMAENSQQQHAQQQMQQNLQMMQQRAQLNGTMDATVQQLATQYSDDGKLSEALVQQFGPGAQSYIKQFYPNGFGTARQMAQTDAIVKYLPSAREILSANPDADLTTFFPQVDPSILQGVAEKAKADIGIAQNDRWRVNVSAEEARLRAEPQAWQPPRVEDVGEHNLQAMLALQKRLIMEDQQRDGQNAQDRTLDLNTKLEAAIMSDPRLVALGPDVAAIEQLIVDTAAQMGITLDYTGMRSLRDKGMAEAQKTATTTQKAEFDRQLDMLRTSPGTYQLPPVSTVGEAAFAQLEGLTQTLNRTQTKNDAAELQTWFTDNIGADPEFTDPANGKLYKPGMSREGVAFEVMTRAEAAGFKPSSTEVLSYVDNLMGDVKVGAANNYEAAAGTSRATAISTMLTENDNAVETIGGHYASEAVAEQMGKFAPSMALVVQTIGERYNLADPRTQAAMGNLLNVETLEKTGINPINGVGLANALMDMPEFRGAASIADSKALIAATSMPEKAVSAEAYTSDMKTMWSGTIDTTRKAVTDAIDKLGTSASMSDASIIAQQRSNIMVQVETLARIAALLPEMEKKGAIIPGTGNLSMADAAIDGYAADFNAILDQLDRAEEELKARVLAGNKPAAPAAQPVAPPPPSPSAAPRVTPGATPAPAGMGLSARDGMRSSQAGLFDYQAALAAEQATTSEPGSMPRFEEMTNLSGVAPEGPDIRFDLTPPGR